MPLPRFEIRKGAGDQYTFHLTAANGEIILSSERYTSRSSAQNGIAAVKANAEIDHRYDRRVSGDDLLYFVLKAGNGEIVGTSETYRSSAARETGIAAVKTNAPRAGVEG